MKGKNKIVSMALILCLAAAYVTTGCGRESGPVVVGETEPGEMAQGEQDPASESFIAQNSSDGMVSAKEMIGAPARYEGEFWDESLNGTADAKIRVPDVEKISLKKVKRANFSEDAFEKIKEVLGKEYGVNWIEEINTGNKAESGTKNAAENNTENHMENGIENGMACYVDADQTVRLDYHSIPDGADGVENDQVSLIWSIHTIGDARRRKPSGSLVSAESFGKNEDQASGRRESADSMEEKAKYLIADCDLDAYEMRMSRWIRNRYSGGEDTWQYWIRYTPSEDGIPLAPIGSSPYLDLTFFEDGALDEFQLVTAYETDGIQKDEVFLLPFQTIRELFEQYMRDEAKIQMDQREEASAEMGSPVTEGRRVMQVAVTKASLEYTYLSREGSSSSEGEKVMVPVWSFYGYQDDAGSERLLLSIRADDGQLV